VADVAGYSRLMAADERATLAALDAARAVFAAEVVAYQGRVIDMAGDSVLAVFDTATGAVAGALAQDALAAVATGVPGDRQMRFRIGVHLGDVIEKSDGTVYGDGVNIAARLQQLAEPGGVMVRGQRPAQRRRGPGERPAGRRHDRRSRLGRPLRRRHEERLCAAGQGHARRHALRGWPGR
jgi:class 3 adenylate cyclase